MSAVKVARAIARVAGWVVAVACVALLVGVGVGPRTGRYATLTVLSGSMRPGIPEGSIVVITPERPDQIRVGQIVTYAVPEGDHHVVSHRVVEIVAGGDQPIIRTQGDANDTPDPWLAQITDDTVWRVHASVPGVGQLIHRLRQPLVHRLSVVVVPLLLAAVWLVDIWRPESTTLPDGVAV
jgi:signal peptidase